MFQLIIYFIILDRRFLRFIFRLVNDAAATDCSRGEQDAEVAQIVARRSGYDRVAKLTEQRA